MTTPLEFREVGFAYAARDGRPGFAIRDLSFSVGAGEIFGVIGPNASGKTTLIRLLSKVLGPARGEILLAGESLGGLSRAAVARTRGSRSSRTGRIHPSRDFPSASTPTASTAARRTSG